MFIIAAGWPHRQTTSSLAFVRILRIKKLVKHLPWEGTAHRELSTQSIRHGSTVIAAPGLAAFRHRFHRCCQTGFKKYATFTGRASRSEYWWWTLFTFVIYLVLGLVTFAVGMATSRDGGRTPGLLAMPLLILFTVIFLGILLPTLAVTVRRLHDGGYSGLVALLFLLPYLGG